MRSKISKASKSRLLLWPVVGASLLASHMAFAFNGRYTFNDLDVFWKNTLKGEQGPRLDLYQGVLKDMDNTPPEQRSRQEGSWQKDQNTVVKVPYFVEPLPSDSAAELSRRELTLHLYMNRESAYEAPAPATPTELLATKALVRKQQATLAGRRLQAAYELFVIKLIRYREGGSLIQKCQALEEAERYLKLGDGQVVTDTSSYDPTALKNYADLLANRYNNDLSTKLVCLAKPAQDRAESLARIETQVNRRIVASLEKESTQTLAPIQAMVAETFEPILDRVYKIDPLTGPLLQFEQDVRAAGASLTLVNDDLFKIQSVIPTLDKIDFNLIRQTSKVAFVPEAIEKVNAKQKMLNDFTRQFLVNLEKLQDLVPTTEKSNFAGCAGLSQEFDRILPKTPTSWGAQTLYPGLGPTDTLLTKLDGCLSKSREYLLRLNQKNSQEKMVEVFAKHLEALTQEYIRVSN
ncbi:MAG TPA: hypothetical protein VFO10_23430 [Oligoflexus sp.]|uniref:hypothetical protein n=1 Tax=Oligoflexus sp. TaxID=1971216 RepID=UPI002D7EC752|nr:hypothetical protein [Oligoflexus sp.]HET9240235.1 hypothetical protein [Oligoflexus sp.]